MPAIGPRSEWLPRPYMSHFLTNKSIFYRGDPMANRKNSHRRRVRVAVLMVLCGAVFAAFFARLAWMQFVRADYYADKAAEASSASYTVTQHAARGAIVDSAGVVLARDTTVYDVYLRLPAPPGTDLRETVKAIESLTGSKDVETQLAAFFAAASAGELPVMQGVGSDVLTSFYKADLVQSGAVRAAARGVRTWPNGTLLPHALGFTGPITAEQWPTARQHGLAMDAVIGQSGLEAAYDDLLRGQDGRVLVNTGFDGAVRRTVPLRDAAPGATLVLTVDSALQKELQNALLSQIEVLRTTKAAGAGRECRAGAAVVVDVQTGGVLAAVLDPALEPAHQLTELVVGQLQRVLLIIGKAVGVNLMDQAVVGLVGRGVQPIAGGQIIQHPQVSGVVKQRRVPPGVVADVVDERLVDGAPRAVHDLGGLDPVNADMVKRLHA